MNKLKLLNKIFPVFFLFPLALLCASVDTAWVRRYNGLRDSVDVANSLAIDRQGNVYVTGYSAGLNTFLDYTTIKYNSAGETSWVRRYNGPGNGEDRATSIAVDGMGNVYVTGFSVGLGTGAYDYATIKYNTNGTQQWVARYNGTANNIDQARAIALDSVGNIYVTGESRGSGTAADYLTIKYYSNGDTAWIRRYNGTGNYWEWVEAIAVDNSGNVYVTGSSYGTSTNDEYATVKYNSAGDTCWVRRYSGPVNYENFALALAIDNASNVYVTGASWGSGTGYDFATIKYNSEGNEQWIRRYDVQGSLSDYAHAIAVDNLSNVYVTGYGYGIGKDIVTIKYNSVGDTMWIRKYNGPGNGDDEASSLVIDWQGNVYVTGTSYTFGTSNDYVTIKYNSAGIQQWLETYNGSGYDFATALSVDSLNNIYTTGKSMGTDYDYATIKYVQVQGTEETVENRKLKIGNFSLYPNPARNYFAIRLPQNTVCTQIKIFNIMGNIVKSAELKGKNNRVSLDGIKNGVYFMQVGEMMIKEKLIVTK